MAMTVKSNRSANGLQGKKLRRFFEPILLCQTLSQGYRDRAPKRVIKPETDSLKPMTAQERFKKFVYKLALVCARERGGGTVTSAGIFQKGQSIVYWLACNQVTRTEGQQVVTHIETLLGMVASVKKDQTPQSQRQDVLKKVLLFNKPRISFYLKMLARSLVDCQKQGFNDPLIIQALQRLEATLVAWPLSGKGSDDDYIDTCRRCLDQIRLNDNKRAFARLRRLAENHDEHLKGLREEEETSWVELPHFASRLYSYEEAMLSFFNAFSEWPQLFQCFEVNILPSSKRQPCPLKEKSFSAENIIGRMSSDKAVTDQSLEYAEELQRFQIDDRLRETSDSFKPVIHSEVLLYDWYNHSKDAQGLQFFNGWRFLGASKPTCRLCKYYIESANAAEDKHRDLEPIEVRAPHDNIYLAWWFPDAHGSSASATQRVWQETYNRMMELIRDDAFRTLEEKSCSGKKHDSNTYDGWSTRASQVGGDEASMNRLSDRFGQGLRLRDKRLGDESEDDEDEDGGAVL